MSWNNQNTCANGVSERGFEVQANGRKVPGVYWLPEHADRLVLLGHGGTAHKKVEYIADVARQLAAKGIASMAIDGPGHGDRAGAAAKSEPVDFAKIWNEGGGHNGMLADWRAALDFIETEAGPRPTGIWGLSMGTMMGLPVAATDSRIKVALLGLMGDWGPNSAQLLTLAPQLTCPVRFLMQWDDEIVPRTHCLNLFDAIGSKHKTLHANPGKHQAVPAFEIAGSVDYLDKHL
ncbi:MAG: alpha/beta fold hydrolase [Proteobacteria bacterium]|nr:alpha/beta fold hydrolase [Pseudomonadota bacterium]